MNPYNPDPLYVFEDDDRIPDRPTLIWVWLAGVLVVALYIVIVLTR